MADRAETMVSGGFLWRSASRAGGFTLIELLIVVLILAILGAIVLPIYQNHRAEAEVAALMSNLRVLREVIEPEQSLTGEYPNPLDASKFVGGLPDHPQNSISLPTFQYANAANVTHPAYKVLKSGVTGAYWYNTANGIVRARVTDQGTSADTLAMYNKINQCNETALGNYSGGGGGGS